jgi:hypothetical protein
MQALLILTDRPVFSVALNKNSLTGAVPQVSAIIAVKKGSIGPGGSANGVTDIQISTTGLIDLSGKSSPNDLS